MTSSNAFYIRLTSNSKVVGDFLASDVSIDRAINEVGSFDFNIPVATLNAVFIDFQDNIAVSLQADLVAQVFLNGVMIASGHVDNIGMAFEDDLVYSFSCNAEMYTLMQKRAKSNSSYQDAQVLGILIDLLTYDTAWKLGDISTMVNPLVRTTLDLRGESRLLPQIKKVCESVPDVYFRYGGNLNEYQRIDIGIFDRHKEPSVETDDVISLSHEMTYSTLLNGIEAYGGEIEVAGVKRYINLNDALAYDPALETDSAYPVVSDHGTKMLKNADLAFGEEIVKYYSEVVPYVKVNPTATAIKQAGYALYQKALTDLKQLNKFENKWDAELRAIPDGLKVGDRVFIRANAQQSYHDYLSGEILTIQIGQVSQWFRVMALTTEIDDEQMSYSLEISDNYRITKRNLFLHHYELAMIAEMAEDTVRADNTANPTPLGTYGIISGTINSGLETNCFNGDGSDYYGGRLYTIPLGVIPNLANGAAPTAITRYDLPFSSTENVEIRVISEASLSPSVGLVVCVSINGDWLPDYSVTLYALMEFT